MTKRAINGVLFFVIGALTACASTARNPQGINAAPTCANGHATIQPFPVANTGPLLPRNLYFDHESTPMAACTFPSSGARFITACTTCGYRYENALWYYAAKDPSKFARSLESFVLDLPAPEPGTRSYAQILGPAGARTESVWNDTSLPLESAWSRMADYLKRLTEPLTNLTLIKAEPQDRHLSGTWKHYHVEVRIYAPEGGTGTSTRLTITSTN